MSVFVARSRGWGRVPTGPARSHAVFLEATRHLVGVLVAVSALATCDATPMARLDLTYRFQTHEGEALSCSQLGAAFVELSLYHLSTDVLPYHRTIAACETTALGVGRVNVAVDAHEYSRLDVRLSTQGGAVVRLCREGSTVEARLLQESVIIPSGGTHGVQWLLEGSPGICPAPQNSIAPGNRNGS